MIRLLLISTHHEVMHCQARTELERDNLVRALQPHGVRVIPDHTPARISPPGFYGRRAAKIRALLSGGRDAIEELDAADGIPEHWRGHHGR